jgi:hypothetical protein
VNPAAVVTRIPLEGVSVTQKVCRRRNGGARDLRVAGYRCPGSSSGAGGQAVAPGIPLGGVPAVRRLGCSRRIQHLQPVLEPVHRDQLHPGRHLGLHRKRRPALGPGGLKKRARRAALDAYQNSRGDCLGIWGGSTDAGARAVGFSCLDNNDQYWRVLSNGSYTLLANMNAFYSTSPAYILGVSGGLRDNGTQIVLYWPDGTPNQRWCWLHVGPIGDECWIRP